VEFFGRGENMKKVKSFILFVDDQQKALDFYTEKLGFKVHTDAKFGEGNRWLSICLPEMSDFEIALTLAKSEEEKNRVGKQAPGENALLGFSTDNIEKDIAALTANGVSLIGELVDQPYGKFIFFQDLYGNRLYLHEEK
jgi:catechol 2,3-dioxygenase-like lactoylglutathione lyase family enzyme